MRSSILTSFLLLFSLCAYAGEAADFVVYEAQSHSADELAKAAAGVTNGARVSVLNSKVVIYGTKAERDRVLKLFGELDHALKNFVVSLRVASKGDQSRDASAVEAGVNGKNVILKKKSGVLTGRGKGTVGIGGEAGSVTASAESSERADAAGSGPQLTVMDGSTARLYADSGIFPKTVTVHVRSLGHSGAHVEIRELDTNAVGTQAVVTEINVPLGEWRTIGGVTTENSGRSGEMFGHAKRSSMSSRDVQLKVEAESK